MTMAVVMGGAGFIGSHIAEELVRTGYTEVVLDNLSIGCMNNLEKITDRKNFTFAKGDILDSEFLTGICYNADIAFHEEAITGVAKSIDNPVFGNEVNITDNVNVLAAARDAGVKRVVFASSASLYGDDHSLPVKETAVLNPQSPYALTRRTGALFHQLYALPTKCLSYFNVFDPRQNLTSKYSAAIPAFVDRVSKNSPPTIYGDGNQTRDFVFVQDVVKANIVVAESNATGVFNIGSGYGTSIDELAQKVKALSDRNLESLHQAAKVGEVRKSVAELTMADGLRYNPDYSLENGLRETVKFIEMYTQIFSGRQDN